MASRFRRWRAGGDREFSDLERRLTWIWGSPRSGSSWLLSLLAHPLPPRMYASLGFNPPRARAAARTAVVPVEELSLASHLAPWPGEILEAGGRWLPGTIPSYSEPRPTYLLAREYESTWRPRVRGLILSRLHAAEQRALEALPRMDRSPTVVVKETPTSHGADRVMRMIPRSRIVMMVRDPRDVVDSLMHAFGPGGFMAGQHGTRFETVQQRIDGVVAAAKLWSMSIDVTSAAIEAHDPALVRTLRYEDLLADPVGELGSLLTWLGHERGDSELAEAVEMCSLAQLAADQHDKGRPVRGAPPGSWRESLTGRELEALREVVGDRITTLGYHAG